MEQLEHIGSTAVPGLAGKPVIDVMFGTIAWPPAQAVAKAVVRLGYEPLGEAGVSERLYFRHRGSINVNLHVVHFGSSHWLANIALREYLRTSEAARDRHVRAKQVAIAGGAVTLLAYSDAKA
jgi:GrpB-like predicted nucleotidyltransferase (UPF0157 family)